MQIRKSLAVMLAVGIGLVCLTLLPGSASADLFIFKPDGFVVEGKLKQEGTISGDGDQWIATGFFYVEDYTRRVFFPSTQVYDPLPRKYALVDPVKFAESFSGGTSLYPIRQIVETGDWNTDKAERQVTLVAGTEKINHQYKLTQHIIKMTPSIVEMQNKGLASQTNWFACYQTRELDPETVRNLLIHHKDFEITKKTPADEVAGRRWKLFHFFARTDWLDVAEKELDGIAKDLPGEKAEVEKNRAFLKEVKIQKLYDLLGHADDAGQYERARKIIKDFPESDVTDQKLLTGYRDLRTRYEAAAAKLEQVHKLLQALLSALDDPKQKAFFQQAVKSLEDEIGLEEVLPLPVDPKRDAYRRYVGRLEAFLSSANPDKLLKSGVKIEPKQASDLLSLAVSGWIRGNAVAENKFGTAVRFWAARQFVQDYLAKETRADRKALLEAYEKDSNAPLTADEVAYLISLMGAADPGEVASGKTIELQTPDRAKVNYLLRLPTEYRHQRPFGYPVLFAMHDGDEEPKDMIKRWAAMADEYGFILVAPKWTGKLQSTYNYTTTEHAAVLEVLRDLRRHYRVDSDRVFLHGLGEGASLVYDVGLSHPDQFAGLVPMSGNPAYFSKAYTNNAQFLPIYAICGECCEQMKSNRSLFSPMGSSQFPIFLVTYRGRSTEFFAGEVPVAFDWMSRKSRIRPIDELGIRTHHFATMRATDDRFYWLSADDIIDGCINAPGVNWKGSRPAAMLHAKIQQKNQINVDTFGLKHVTVWLGDDRDGLVNFENPVKVVVQPTSSNPIISEKKIKPSLAVLLEDFYARGDNKRLMLAKVEVDIK